MFPFQSKVMIRKLSEFLQCRKAKKFQAIKDIVNKFDKTFSTLKSRLCQHLRPYLGCSQRYKPPKSVRAWPGQVGLSYSRNKSRTSKQENCFCYPKSLRRFLGILCLVDDSNACMQFVCIGCISFARNQKGFHIKYTEMPRAHDPITK